MLSLRTHIKETIKLSIPVSIGQLGHIMMGVVDSLMVGHVGSVPLAASALVNGLFFLVLVIGIGMSMAITPLVAIARGQKNYDDCGIVLRQGIIVNVTTALILFVLVYSLSFVIKYFDQPQDVVVYAESYCRIIACSIFPFMIFQIYRQFLEGLSDVHAPMYIAIAANIFNALFNWVLIFGKFGIEPMELDGAGWSTFGTRSLMAFALMLYVIRGEKYKKFDTSLNFRSINRKIINKLVSIGLPSGMQYFLEVAAFACAAIMIGWISANDLAAHQIALNLASVTYMMILGISAAGTIRVSSAVGEKNITKTRRAGFSALMLAAFVMLFFAIIFIAAKSILPTFYVNETEVIELASQLLIAAALFQVSDGVQATCLGVLRGLTDVKAPMLFTFAAYWLLGIPVGYYLAFKMGLNTMGVWIGFIISLSSLAILLVYRFNKKSKTRIIN